MGHIFQQICLGGSSNNLPQREELITALVYGLIVASDGLGGFLFVYDKSMFLRFSNISKASRDGRTETIHYICKKKNIYFTCLRLDACVDLHTCIPVICTSMLPCFLVGFQLSTRDSCTPWGTSDRFRVFWGDSKNFFFINLTNHLHIQTLQIVMIELEWV